MRLYTLLLLYYRYHCDLIFKELSIFKVSVGANVGRVQNWLLLTPGSLLESTYWLQVQLSLTGIQSSCIPQELEPHEEQSSLSPAPHSAQEELEGRWAP